MALLARSRDYLETAGNQTAEPLMNPAAIAEFYWDLVKQDRSAWSLEVDLWPHPEKFLE